MNEVHDVHKTEGATSTPLLPQSRIESSMSPDSSQDLHSSTPNHTGVPSRFSTMISLQSMQRIYHSIRRGLSILPWIETPILPGIYWRNVGTSLVLSFHVVLDA
jgi:hypothetical protein